jgi:hypothetical protein
MAELLKQLWMPLLFIKGNGDSSNKIDINIIRRASGVCRII